MSTLSQGPVRDGAAEINRAIGKRIKILRLTHGNTQEALGRVLGLTFQQAQKYENASNKISADKLWRLAQHYGVELEYFFQDIQDDPDKTMSTVGDSTARARLLLDLGREARRLPPRLLRSLLGLIRGITGGSEESAVLEPSRRR